MNQGSSNSEACRTVGINRRTGSRWRFGRTVERGDGHQLYYAPIATPVILSGRSLSPQERLVIADGLRAGRSRRSIAAELKRSPSTISREVARNSDPDSGEYRPWAAQQQAAGRRGRPKPRKLVAHAELRQIVQQGLEREVVADGDRSPVDVASVVGHVAGGDQLVELGHADRARCCCAGDGRSVAAFGRAVGRSQRCGYALASPTRRA